MPKYEFITRQVIERVYELEVPLPLDIGTATPKFTDRLVKMAANENAMGMLNESPEAKRIEVDDSGEEEVTSIWREGRQIWPRIRKNISAPATKPEAKEDEE